MFYSKNCNIYSLPLRPTKHINYLLKKAKFKKIQKKNSFEC